MGYKHELEALILGALMDGPLHGYRIAQSIRARGEGLLKMGDNQIYPTLHRLEEDGLVKADWVPQEGKPARKVYELSDQGKSCLERHQKEWKRYVATFNTLIGANNV